MFKITLTSSTQFFTVEHEGQSYEVARMEKNGKVGYGFSGDVPQPIQDAIKSIIDKPRSQAS